MARQPPEQHVSEKTPRPRGGVRAGCHNPMVSNVVNTERITAGGGVRGAGTRRQRATTHRECPGKHETTGAPRASHTAKYMVTRKGKGGTGGREGQGGPRQAPTAIPHKPHLCPRRGARGAKPNANPATKWNSNDSSRDSRTRARHGSYQVIPPCRKVRRLPHHALLPLLRLLLCNPQCFQLRAVNAGRHIRCCTGPQSRTQQLHKTHRQCEGTPALVCSPTTRQRLQTAAKCTWGRWLGLHEAL